MERWKGCVAVVTGASAGIGAVLCRRLAQRGLRIIAVARRIELLQTLAEEAKKENLSGQIYPIQGDVTKEEDVKRVVKWARDNLGGVDILVNNAGVIHEAPLMTSTTEQWRHQLDVNILGLCMFTREVIKDLRERNLNEGHVIHINSVLGHHHYYFNSLNFYTATKHAVTILTEGLRRELRDIQSNIRITSVSPGMVKTDIMLASGSSKEESEEFYRQNPHLKSEDVADAVEFILGAPPSVNVEEITLRVTCASD